MTGRTAEWPRLRSFFTIRDVLQLYPALALRLFLLSSQYRQAINYTQRALEEVHAPS